MREEVSAVEVDSIVSIISQFGFPILTCLILFWYIYNENKNHKEEMAKMSDAINNNTIALNKLIDKLDKE